jgi:GNAT superfamily N-acetyltransferase
MSKPVAGTLIIRQARVDDVETLVGFSAAMASETEGRSLDRERLRLGTQAVLASPDRGFYLVAEASGSESGQVVGQLLITYEWSDWRNGVFWWIQSVYVHPAWRRRGVYRRMHDYVIEQAQARKDVCGVRLYVEGDNEIAKTVYGRVGLAVSSYRVFEDDFVLKKNSAHLASSKAMKSARTDRHRGKGRKRG